MLLVNCSSLVFNILKLLFLNWSHVVTYVNKAEASSDLSDKERDTNTQATFTKLKYGGLQTFYWILVMFYVYVIFIFTLNRSDALNLMQFTYLL